MIAKSDASCEKNERVSGYYIIERVTPDVSKRIAKSDASLVKIYFISGSCANAPDLSVIAKR